MVDPSNGFIISVGGSIWEKLIVERWEKEGVVIREVGDVGCLEFASDFWEGRVVVFREGRIVDSVEGRVVGSVEGRVVGSLEGRVVGS